MDTSSITSMANVPRSIAPNNFPPSPNVNVVSLIDWGRAEWSGILPNAAATVIVEILAGNIPFLDCAIISDSSTLFAV